MFSARTRAENPDLVENAFKRAMGFDRGGVARSSLAVVVHRKNVLRELGRIKVPTLVMCGTEDLATVPEQSRKIAYAIPGARLVMLDGLGHMSALEAPERVNEHLVPFVRTCVAGE